jgi:hypothetical protein
MKQQASHTKTTPVNSKSDSLNNGTKKSTSTGFALFDKENYKLMLIGLVLILAGFFLLSGGGSEDPNVFNDIKNDFRRWTLAPIVIIAGFALEIWAIMKKPKSA